VSSFTHFEIKSLPTTDLCNGDVSNANSWLQGQSSGRWGTLCSNFFWSLFQVVQCPAIQADKVQQLLRKIKVSDDGKFTISYWPVW
jgi:hypothetical protein